MKTTILAALLVLTAGLPGTAHEPARKGEEGQILALENAWNQAELQHDPGALDQILIDDFVIYRAGRHAANQERAHGVHPGQVLSLRPSGVRGLPHPSVWYGWRSDWCLPRKREV